LVPEPGLRRRIQATGRATAAWQGGQLPGLPLATQEFADEGDADAKPGGDVGLSRPGLGTRLRDTLPQIKRIRLHTADM
jgi:hypothetical protein